MKKSLKIAALACVAAMFTGCAFTSHLTSNANITETSVQLSTNNYRVVKKVSGSASETYIFGIGGLSKSALAKNSYAEMVANADLKDNQAIINVSTSERTQNIVVYTKREMTTSGVVIEFCK